MMRALMVIFVIGISFGCARIRVEAPKEAIKLDVSMRLDIYQHIQSDIDDIENMVSGPGKKAKGKDEHSFLNLFISKAYADDLPAAVQEAALRRKDRREQLSSFEETGAIGETRLGMVVVKKSSGDIQPIVDAENADRKVIYQAVANKNGSSVDEVARLYAKRLQNDAPSGTPIETDDGWQIK